jgi:ABC-type spermidine/putrescine transport system permease subunit I
MAATEVSQAPSTPQEPRRRPKGAAATWAILGAPIAFIVFAFVLPVILIAVYSVGGISGLSPNDIPQWTLTPWKDFITSSTYMGGINPMGSGLFWKSVRMSTVVSITSLVLAYPIAYLLAMLSGKRKYTLLLIIIVPFLTSYLLRILAWRVLLNPQGVINTLLVDQLGILDSPITWLFNSTFAIYLVLSYVWVPFVALPIFVVLEGLDEQLLEASADLGASRWRTFRTVTFPLSLPGVIAGFIFVFIPTIGEFITPQLVGGPKGFMFGSAIQSAFTAGLDWQFGSAMAMFLVFTVAVLLAIFGRHLNVRGVAG